MTVQVSEESVGRAPRGTVNRPDRVKRRRLSRRGERLIAIATPIVLLAIWELLARTGTIDAKFYPAPTTIFGELWGMAAEAAFWTDLWVSARRFVLGFVIGVVPALIIGVAMGLYRPIRAALQPLVSATYPIPKSSLVPLFLLFFGLGESGKYIFVAVGVFYPVVINTVSGVINVSSTYYDVAKNFGASKWHVFKTVAIPGAMPSIVTGVELGAGMGLIMLVIIEMLGGATEGIGFMIWNAWQLLAVERMYVGLLIVAVIGFVLALLVGAVGRRLTPWNRNR